VPQIAVPNPAIPAPAPAPNMILLAIVGLLCFLAGLLIGVFAIKH